MNTRIEFDVSNFTQSIGFLIARGRAKSPTAMEKAVKEWRNDSINVPPKCPKRFGGLIESHEISVETRFIGVTEGIIHVRKPFARALHEGVTGPNLVPVRNWTEPGSGPKWVESKLYRFYEKYLGTVAAVIFGGGLSA